jgi:hypothetical protein
LRWWRLRVSGGESVLKPLYDGDEFRQSAMNAAFLALESLGIGPDGEDCVGVWFMGAETARTLGFKAIPVEAYYV